jgi:1,4-alpha-glucan branching enzyme
VGRRPRPSPAADLQRRRGSREEREPVARPSRPAPARAPAPPPQWGVTAANAAEAAKLRAAIGELVQGDSDAPFGVLGPHLVDLAGTHTWVVRVFLPGAREVALVLGRSRHPMTRIHGEGVFEVVLPAGAHPPSLEAPPVYTLEVTDDHGATRTIDDPYRFAPVLSAFDLHLFGEGTHQRLHEKLGAQVMVQGGARGVNFAVWAPNARRVSVIGDFNRWDARAHPMRLRGETGVWELFVPGLAPGELYKYDVRTHLGGLSLVKADPYGFAMELRPKSASIVWDPGRYRWKDAAWMAARAKRQAYDRPLAIYEVHPGSWKRVGAEENRWLTWRELASELVPYVKRMGFTHIELLPVTEHPYDGSWGYQPVGYFAPTSRFGTPDDFRAFVDAAHAAGLGVVLDWVPAHFPKDAHGLAFFDGTHLYEHADPRKGEHRDWGTYVYNLSRPQVSGFLLSSALFWLEQFHIDGLRVDAVASMLYLDYSRKEGEWVPNIYGGRENLEAIDFVRRFNTLVHERFPGTITFAEESTSWPQVTGPVDRGGLGFDYKWNMGWMNDMLGYMRLDPLYRGGQQNRLTFSLHYAYSERFLLPLSHDEVVHGKRSLLHKMPGSLEHKFANLRALYGYMTAHPGKKLLFMGAEIGQIGEWNFTSQVGWHLLEEPLHAKLQTYVRALNRLLASEPALHEVDFHWEGFEWIDFQDAASSVVSFVRRAKDRADAIVVVANFTPVPRPGYRVGLPAPGRYVEIVNSDDAKWGGTGTGHPRGLAAEAVLWHGLEHSVEMTLPPLAVIMLKQAMVKAPRVRRARTGGRR